MNRRGFLAGMLAAPVLIKTPGLLMPVKPRVIYPITIENYISPAIYQHINCRCVINRQVAEAMGIPEYMLKGNQNEST